MSNPLQTRLSLLVRLRDSQDAQVWPEFVELYAPLIHGFACKQGLQDADAAHLSQEVLRAVARTIKHLNYDPARGSFRNWLARFRSDRGINITKELADQESLGASGVRHLRDGRGAIIQALRTTRLH